MTTPIPAGWKPMPTTMTLDMCVAFAEAWFSKVRCIDDHEMQDAYAAMLAAAPSPATVAPGDAQDEHATYSMQPTPCSLQPVATAFFTEKGEVAYTGIFDRTLKALESVKTTRMGISAGSIDLYAARASAPAAGDALASFDIEAAAKKMAECMDYPWAHMPEQGRTNMRKYAQAVIDAAIAAQQGKGR